MKMKKLMAVGFATAMLMGAGAVSAATVTYLNDGTAGTSHSWTGTGYNPSILDPQLASAPHQTGALSGLYGGSASGVAGSFASGDVWKLNTDVDATVSLSVDYTGIGANKLTITSVVLRSDSPTGTVIGTGVGSLLTNAPWDAVGTFRTFTFASLNLLATTNYYLTIIGSYTGAGTSQASSYSIGTPAANTLSSATPIPGAVWLFGTGIAGLVGASKRKKAKAALTA